VSIASVGTGHPLIPQDEICKGSFKTGTNLDECRSNAVDHS